MNNFKKIITCLLISLFSISLIPNNVFALDLKDKNRNEKEEIEYFNDGTLNLGEKEFKILNAIENIPDEIIASGSDSINEYFKEKGINEIKVSDKVRKKRGVVGCISAVGIAVVVNFTPAKIAKVKSVLKAVGGAAKFVKKTVGLYNKFKATKAKLAAAKAAVSAAAQNISGREILLELFSLGSVYSECFE
ncbi:TPA: hypothetical protein I9080_003459 [Clostridium perfringens]|uniref:Uncharacterized protein n=1 Tax=Clostridium perfringens TaxID=1502 RepID=A0A8H9UYE3_CLOPF|nr:hypothetical protein [Clostridium perfringens]HAT4315906.1 hypothetical protein [Clostridium perfringens]HAT4368380.1 hypothetical protein [Clostridium perfringens]